MNVTSITRRHFVAASAALPFALKSLAQTTSPQWILIGTDKGAGIYRARWNAATGEIGKPELAIAADRPNYFAMHPRLPVLYSTNAVAGDRASISAFRVDVQTASLMPISRMGSDGDGPCYVSVDRTGQMAFSANYIGGSFAAFALGPKGELEKVVGQLQCKDNAACGKLGTVTNRQEKPHLHCATVSPHNDFVLACDLGDDAIEVIPIHPETQTLGTPVYVQARVGSGPRHVAFHPNGRWLYCIHELDCTIDVYDWKVRGGKPVMTLRGGSTISTLKPGTSLTGNTACEVVVSESGKFLYTCSRGDDEIVVYHIHPGTGLLTEQQRLSAEGTVPRMLNFDPSRKWLLCSNQGSSNITIYAHDAATGKLTFTGRSQAADTPMFVQFL